MSDTNVILRSPSKPRNIKRPTFQVVSPSLQSEKYHKSSSLSTITITKSSTLTKSVESQKFSDDNLRRPKRILKYKSISPVKQYKRLQSQGTIKKSKIVTFKSDLVETKNVPSMSFLAHLSVNKGNYRPDDLVLTKCTCACFIF